MARVTGLRAVRAQLDPSHWRLLVLLGNTAFFDGFDRGIVDVALPQIRDDFGLTQSSASGYLALVYLGALPALAITRFSDTHGRKRVLLFTIAGYTVATVATSLAPNPAAFVACQFVARVFLNAEAAIVWTLVAEEMPAKVRGFGFGWLAMNTALGVGAAALLFGVWFEPSGISWRWLYVVGLPPLLIIGMLRRRLPESRRFVTERDAGRLAGSWRAILGRRRTLAQVVAITFLLELMTQTSVFSVDFLQTDRDVSATAANLMLVAAGFPGLPFMIWAGSLSDRLGRRTVGVGCIWLSIVGGLAFVWLPGGVPVLLPAMCLSLLGSLGAWPVLNGIVSELFPTAVRGQATAWATVARVLGQASSLGLAKVFLDATDSFSWTATFLAVGPFAGAILALAVLPDTHGRELEDISGDAVIGRHLPP